jgi:flagellar hook protein FlgE
MVDGLGAAVSGLRAHSTRLEVAAHNTANASTRGFQDQVVNLAERQSGGVDATVVSPARLDANQPVDNAAGPSIKPRASLGDLGSGADLQAATITQITASNAFKAQSGVIKNGGALTGTLVDVMG